MATASHSFTNKTEPTPWVVVVVLEPDALNVFAGGVKHQINGYNHRYSLIEGGRDPENPNETVHEAAQRLLGATASIGPTEFLVATKRALSMAPDDSSHPNDGAIIVGPNKAVHVLYYIAHKPHPHVDPKAGDPISGLSFNKADWIPPHDLCETLKEGASRERIAFYRELSDATKIVVDTARQWCVRQAKHFVTMEDGHTRCRQEVVDELHAAALATLASDYDTAAYHYRSSKEIANLLRRDDVAALAAKQLPGYVKGQLVRHGSNFTATRDRPFSPECGEEGLYHAKDFAAHPDMSGGNIADTWDAVLIHGFEGASTETTRGTDNIKAHATKDKPHHAEAPAARPTQGFLHKVTRRLKSMMSLHH